MGAILSYFEEGVRLLELEWNAQRLFEKQDPFETLAPQFPSFELDLELEELHADLLQAETPVRAAQPASENRPNLAKTEICRGKFS